MAIALAGAVAISFSPIIYSLSGVEAGSAQSFRALVWNTSTMPSPFTERTRTIPVTEIGGPSVSFTTQPL